MSHKHTIYNNSGNELIVYLHGWMSSGSGNVTSKNLSDVLNNRFCIFSPDFPGSGGLAFIPVGTTFRLYAEWILKIIHKHFPNKQFHLIGNSMGGMIAQELTLLSQEHIKSLILIATTACLSDKDRPIKQKVWNKFLSYRRGDDLKKQLSVGLKYLVVPKSLKKMRQAFMTVDPLSLPDVKTLNERYEAMKHHDTRPHLGEIHVPTLIIGAKEDQLIPQNHSLFLASNIPNAKLHMITPSGHTIAVDAPHKLLEKIKKFLNKQSADTKAISL